MTEVNVLLTCIGGYFSFDTISALRADPDLSVRVVGVDANPDVVNRHFVDSFYAVPNAGSNPLEFGETLYSICRKENVQIVMPGADEEVFALSRNLPSFEAEGIRCAVETPEKVDIIRDKVRLCEHLEKAGIRMPKYASVNSVADMIAAVDHLGYPDQKFILKPATGRGARGLLVVDDNVTDLTLEPEARGYTIGSLEKLTDFLTDHDLNNYMAMEYLQGPVYDVDCVAKNGIPLCIVPRRRLAEGAFSRGVEGHEIERREDMESLTQQITAALSMNYLFDCDFSPDAQGRPGFLELNPRSSGSVCATRAAGVNLPIMLVRSLLKMPLLDTQIVSGGLAFSTSKMVFLPPLND